MNANYKIISQQKGKDIHSKAYILKELDTGKELIVKIYESSRHKYYRKECLILELINNSNNNFEYKKNFFVMYKEIEFQPHMFPIPDEVIGFNLQFLFFDYLPKFSLLDYISGEKQYIEEIHVKYLCFELLMAIKNLHKINVCPNNLDIFNIIFDSNFQPKMIHFCEAEIIISDSINDIKAKFNNDFFYLGKILAKLISFGKFKTIIFNKKKNCFEIKTNFQKNSIEETTFWKMMKTFNINISEEFFNFFHILINAKKSKEIVDIDNLLKNEWLNDINQELEMCKNKFLNDFKQIYEKIIENREIKNKIDIDLKDIIDINNNRNEDSIIKSILPKKGKEVEYLSGDQLIEKNSENDNFIKEKDSLSKDSYLNSKNPNLFDINNSSTKLNMNNNKSMNNNIPINNILDMNNNMSMNNIMPMNMMNVNNNIPINNILDMNNNMSMNNIMPMNMMNMNNNIPINNNLAMNNIMSMNMMNMNMNMAMKNNMFINNNIAMNNNMSINVNMNEIYQNNNNLNNNNIKNNINESNNNFENINMKNNFNNNFLNIDSNNINQNIYNLSNNNINNNYLNNQNSNNNILPNLICGTNSSLNEFSYNYKKDNEPYLYYQKKSYFGNNIYTLKKARNDSKPKKGDFNYLEINIKENNLYKDEDINKTLKNFIKNYMKKIKENYSFSNIRIDFKNITDFSFDINYDIFSFDINIDINELTFLDEKYEEKFKNPQTFKIKVELININSHQYYLIFNGVNVNQEDYYEELKLLKNSAKSLLIKN